MGRYNVLIVDDQNMSRQLFESFVNGSEEFQLVAALDTAKIASVYCQTKPVDLVLMDVVMKDGSNGLEEAARIKEIRPDIKIIIVTSMPEVGYIRRARAIGVESFWYKEIEQQPLITVMKRTMEGESVYPDRTPEVTLGLAKSSEFTERELDVLRELTSGISNQEIADRLQIGIGTVKSHIKHMTEKTGLSRTQLAIRARTYGVVIGEDKEPYL